VAGKISFKESIGSGDVLMSEMKLDEELREKDTSERWDEAFVLPARSATN
jgi:hypothetical protein